MAAYPRNVWNQIKSLTADQLIKALKKDGYVDDGSHSARLAFIHPDSHNRIVIHYHPGKTYGEKLLRHLLSDIGWTVEDLRRLKLIKRR